MNATEDIPIFKDYSNYQSPALARRTLVGHSYDFPEKKKDKKWSISSIFRRKKKESESSSEEDSQKRNFLGRKKKKNDSKRKRHVKTIGTFDHIVLPPRNSLSYDDNGILSDPTGGVSLNYSNYSKRPLPQTPKESLENSRVSITSSIDSNNGRKSRKELTKARAEARRTSSRNASSSDEESNSSLKIRSEENLRLNSKRSRSARTERYLKRHSRDGENPHNYLRLSKSDAENSVLNWKLSDDNRSASRSPLPPPTTYLGLSTIPPVHNTHARYRVSNSTSNPSYKPPQSMNDYNNRKVEVKPLQDQRSISCDANIHKAPSAEFNEEILHVQFPVIKPNRGYRNLSLIDPTQLSKARQPPPPPPRMYYFENNRPNTFYVDKTNQNKNNKFGSFNLHRGFRSCSEDCLPRDIIIRPPSTTSDITPRLNVKQQEDFNYLTDKNPRSRKPIFIQTKPEQKPIDFWKQIDKQNNKQRSDSPQMFTSRTSVQTKVFIPVQNGNSRTPSPFKPNIDTKAINSRSPSPFKTITNTKLDEVPKDDVKRKSSNLEEALDELEAIYKSLKLGDEDLLERAEQREKETQQMLAYPNYSVRGTLSDSGFSYEPFDSLDSPRRKRFVRKNRTIDLKQDDMAFRKLNKDRSHTINDPQSVISKISYLEASPVHSSKNNYSCDATNNANEPNITQDDVVYRNIKHANTILKVLDPQPPFGIPLGPITPASNSDYLHAKSENVSYKPLFKHKKIPDIVKDDLAYRNLRKDDNKGPALPPLSAEDYRNNNNADSLNYLKKKRAQRSLSANISLITHKYNNNDVENEFKTLTDIADAMEIARKVLREKDNRITATKKAFMSDNDTHYVKSYKDDRLSCKPPRGMTRSPKESTPIPMSPLEGKKSDSESSSSLDDILNALAEEAKETTERISNELEILAKKSSEVDKKLSEIDAVSEHAKLCEKLLDCVVDSTNLMASSKPEEVETVEKIEPESVEVESANVVVDRSTPKQKDAIEDHDYENLHSDKELNVDEVDVTTALKDGVNNEEELKCRSPFEERKQELIASFQELKEDEVDCDEEQGELCGDSFVVALPNKECASFTINANPLDRMYVSNCDTKRVESETSSGFHSSCSCESNANLESLESLKSPKLVMETSNKINNSSRSFLEATRNDRREGYRNEAKAYPSWYRDPATLAIACSYGIACAHQLASIDLYAVLGILFAVISFIAALFL